MGLHAPFLPVACLEGGPHSPESSGCARPAAAFSVRSGRRQRTRCGVRGCSGGGAARRRRTLLMARASPTHRAKQRRHTGSTGGRAAPSRSRSTRRPVKATGTRNTTNECLLNICNLRNQGSWLPMGTIVAAGQSACWSACGWHTPDPAAGGYGPDPALAQPRGLHEPHAPDPKPSRAEAGQPLCAWSRTHSAGARPQNRFHRNRRGPQFGAWGAPQQERPARHHAAYGLIAAAAVGRQSPPPGGAGAAVQRDVRGLQGGVRSGLIMSLLTPRPTTQNSSCSNPANTLKNKETTERTGSDN